MTLPGQMGGGVLTVFVVEAFIFAAWLFGWIDRAVAWWKTRDERREAKRYAETLDAYMAEHNIARLKDA